MRELARRAFGIDTRSLAVFRIALGILLLADIAWRLPHFEAWLTEEGAWPIAAARSENPRAWSLYFLSGSPVYTASLLSLAAAGAIALIAGWQTRIATVLSWVLLVSLQTRNELPINAGDIVLRLLLFWSAFLPLNACWSLDRGRGEPGAKIASVASAALLLQVALVYVFNALYKTGEAWKSGAAIELVLRQETYATGLGAALLEWPRLLALATHATWWFELLGPFVALMPWRRGLPRTLVAVGFIGFHLALMATLRIGLFPLICVAAWIPFLSTEGWSAKARAVEVRSPWPAQILAGLALAMVLVSNVVIFAGGTRPAWLRRTCSALGLDQHWSLFAPNPSREEGWMIVVIETSDGKEHDSFTGGEVDWARPAHLGESLSTGPWRKFLAAARSRRHPKRAQWFASWRAREWQRMHPEETIARTRVHYLWEWIEKRQDPPDHWLVFEHPPGPLSEEARRLGYPVAPVSENADL